MPSERARLAIAMTLLMVLSPVSYAGVSNWSGPSMINSDGTPTVVDGFTVPTNATVMDGWVHVTNSPLPSSSDSGIVWDEDSFGSGNMFGVEMNDDGDLVLKDDGTRSNVSTFDVGEIEVTLNSDYTYSPGWRRVFVKSSSTNLSGCSGSAGDYIQHGLDNNFNQVLDSDELIDTLVFCESFANDDVITSLSIDDPGTGYSAGNLSATGGGGSGFSGTYAVSSGIESITINNGGSGFDTTDQVQIQCQCDGTGAQASVGSVDSSGAITSINIDSEGSGYQSTDVIAVGVANGTGESLTANVYSTGVIHSAIVTDGGSNYTSSPTIVISDTNGADGDISAVLGDYYEYEVDILPESSGANCTHSGFKVLAGLDLNENRNLDSTEISETVFICHESKLWRATTFLDLNGTIFGEEQTLAHGIVPSSSPQGLVSAGTMPGEPVPAGTFGHLVVPAQTVPNNQYISAYYLTFDHWYHLDSTISGGGDGTWVEYRLQSDSNWGNWSYIEPQGGYPSTLSTDAPVPSGASSPVPVFASDSHSGWVTSNFSLSSLSGIDQADNIQFRFVIWTHPDSTNERPGWFIDQIETINEGVDLDVWHHGCYTTTASSCTYNSNAYGVLERNIDLTGTNSSSKIEFNMEWDLEGGSSDNACIELSLNGNTWADISSSTSSTSSDCSARSGPIPGNGYTADNGQTYGDQSGEFRLVSFDIPSGFQDQSSVDIRIVVDTSSSFNYGGGTPDRREGLTISQFRVVDYDGSTMFVDDFSSSSTMSHYGMPDSQGNPAPDDWIYRLVTKGVQSEMIGFEDSTANSPTVSEAPGWTRSTSGTCSNDKCKFTLNKLSSNSGPPLTASFPYAYGVGFSGNYENGIDEARLISPSYDIPLNGTSYLTFDHWSCSEAGWDGGAVFIKVNNGAWQYFDPGWYSGTASSFAGHNLQGMGIFTMDHCTGTAWSGTWASTSQMTNLRANLDAYKGDSVKFKFAFGSDGYYSLAGWFIDNAGVQISNFGIPGSWLSPSISLDSDRKFNLGFVDIEGHAGEDGWIRGSLLEASTGAQVPGFSNISFPFSLAGVDAEQYPQVRLKVHMGSDDPEQTPSLEKVHIGGKRVLNADSGQNGWEYSAGIEVVDGLLNATAITGTISSEFVFSPRPIKSVTIYGNISSTVSVTIYDKLGNSLGSASKGGTIQFPSQQVGFSTSVTLPTNGWIDVLRITSSFSNPPSNPHLDVLNDGSDDWEFPMIDDSGQLAYGNLGWQSWMTLEDSYSRSASLALDGTNPQSLTALIPESATVNSGFVSISPDDDGFESPVTVSVAGSSISGGSGNSAFTSILSQAQISGIGYLNPTHTDAQNGRDWLEVPISVSSNSAQTVHISSMGIGYLFFENVSGLGPGIEGYLDGISDVDFEDETDIPLSYTSDYGALSLDGSIVYDFMFVNRDFSVPNTFYPDGEIIEIVTSHHHLYDNSQLADITLVGTSSDGQSIGFRVENSPDGLWGAGSGDVQFSQNSGDSIAPLSVGASYVTESLHSDGYVDIEVHWKFKVDWNWDDVESIEWEARANDLDGETIWPATSESGRSGENAVENDLQIDYFEIRDQFDRVISNTYDTLFYPFPIQEGGPLNISGTVRFQDNENRRPQASDFSVALNLSGSIYPLQVGDQGSFSGVIQSPTGLSSMTLSPLMLRVGPSSSTNGAEDTTGVPPMVDIVVDNSPPVASRMQVQTPVGLQFVDGMVVPPTTFSPYITISEDQARGESLTLRYWREGVDDQNSDGIADESEYQSQNRELSVGLTGEQQVQFMGIDVSSMDNELIHLYVEGTDWVGLSYQDGSTGGGPGATNSWASVVVAEDVMVEFAGAGLGTGSGGGSTFSLDRLTQDSIDYFLVPGIEHTFKVRLDEPNGFRTIDNISVFLCGYGSEYGVFSYEPFTSTLLSPSSSMLEVIGASTEAITSTVTELSVRFKISWDMPFTEQDFDCKPRVLVEDGLDQIESEVLSSLSWRLDNRISAIPNAAEDLSEPIIPALGTSLYLGQGDTFSVSGSVHHEGSGIRISEVNQDLTAVLSMTYGSGNYESLGAVDANGNFTVEMTLPNFQPIEPTTVLTTSLIGVPGNAHSVEDSQASVTVDTKPPTALFNVEAYPDSSLTVIETNNMDSVTVTITIMEEIGMNFGPLQVSWAFQRNGQIIPGTEDSGEVPWFSSVEGVHVYRGELDFSPSLEFEISDGDKVSFWITSTDKAGNQVAGLGGPDSPRTPTIRLVEFDGQYTRSVVTPTKNPLVGDKITVVTYWENPGKNEGTISVGLYEQRIDGTFQPSISTLINGPVELYLPPGSSSVKAEFEYSPSEAGQPLLVLVVDGDYGNDNYMNVEISDIQVSSLSEGGQSGGEFVLIAGSLLILVSLMGAAFYVIRRSAGDSEYYDEEYEDYEEYEE